MKCSFDSCHWDMIPIPQKDRLIGNWIIEQFYYNKKNIPFCAQFYKGIEFINGDIQEIVQKMPVMNKQSIKSLYSPYELVNKEMLNAPHKLKVQRGTGGSTGKPVSIFYSENDWRASLLTHLRHIGPILHRVPKPWIVYNNYHAGHIAALIFSEALTKLGAIVIARHFCLNDEDALQELINHKCNIILTPPTTTHKGTSLEKFLDIDTESGTHYINGRNVQLLLLSSTSLSGLIYEEVRSLNIPFMLNFYGSTEVLPVAISCEKDPFSFHLVEGHIQASVVDENQVPILTDGRGKILTGRIRSQTKSRKLSPADSMGFLNFFTGDEACITSELCACGRNTRTISQIERVSQIEEKLLTGCQAW